MLDTCRVVGSVIRERIFSSVALAGAVAADDADDLALADLERHVAQRPEPRPSSRGAGLAVGRAATRTAPARSTRAAVRSARAAAEPVALAEALDA